MDADVRLQPWTLLLVTESYPWSIAVEDTFIAAQIPFLRKLFGRVILVPFLRQGSRAATAGVEVDESIAVELDGRWSDLRLVLKAVGSRVLWEELANRPTVLVSPLSLKLLLRTVGRAETARRWFNRRVMESGLSPSTTVAYSFWFDHGALGVALMKRSSPGLVAVARANGGDLFEERHHPPYLPCRRVTLDLLDRVFAASAFARTYAVSRYPNQIDRLEVARLGVSDPGFEARASTAARFVVASCSGLVPVKRVDRIFAGVTEAARRRPEVTFEWHHFGDGRLRADLEREARNALPTNASYSLHGHRRPEEIMAFYRDHAVDVFVNASSSEGGSPVAIMEAISCGIPVIATAVGGNPEIVTPSNGVLLGAEAVGSDVADAIVALVDDVPARVSFREGSRRLWRERFDANHNYATFIGRLASLRGPQASDRDH